jgi:hypothetical protein
VRPGWPPILDRRRLLLLLGTWSDLKIGHYIFGFAGLKPGAYIYRRAGLRAMAYFE